jgi:hypothetical protein
MRLRTFLVLAVAVVAPLAARAQNISTVAGGGPINLPKRSASIGAPAAVRQDSFGDTYILDNNFNRVYKVDHVTGNMTVYAGNGANGFAGDNALAVNAELSGPSGMCMDASNNLFIADSDNAVVRVVPATTMNLVNPVRILTAGNIYTFAGTPMRTNFVYGGDGGPATSAFLHFPDGCGVDSVGNVYIADKDNNAIRVVSATTGNISLFAGSSAAVPPAPPALGYGADGTVANSAALNAPWDVFVDSSNNVFIADTGNNVIREVPFATVGLMLAGHIYTVAGTPNTVGSYNGQNIAATSARLNGPKGLFVDAAGDIFFADQVNQVIREVPAVAATGMIVGNIYDVAGRAGIQGYAGDGTPAVGNKAALSSPAGTFVDSTGSIFIADSSSDAIRQVASNTSDYTTELIDTFAGNGHLSYADGAPATHGELNVPAGIFVDAIGNLVIADAGTPILTNSLIRKVAAPISTGNLTIAAGKPEFNGFFEDGGSVSNSVVNNAIGVANDASGNTYIADTDNCIVREITGGNIVTVAGTDPTTPDLTKPQNTTPVCGFSAQGGVATSTILGAVNGVAVDGSGNVFFSDVTNNVIWEVPKATAGSMTAGHAYIVVGTQQLVGSFGGEGGPATGAQLNSPTGIFIDVFGNLFIADTKNNLIREVPADNTTNPSPMTAGHIYTVAGNQGLPAGFGGDGAAATSAQLNNPFTMVADHAGNIFIADTNNQVIREVSAANGNINTVAGTPQSAGFSGDGAAATAAQLDNPEGLALDGAGDLLVADSVNNRVRSIAGIANVAAVPVASFDQTSLTFAIQLLNTPSAAQVVTLTNTGSATLNSIAITITGANSGDFALAPASTCGASLAVSVSCTISVKFTPTAIGARTASVRIADSATGSPQTVTLTGTGGLPTATLGGTTLTFANQLVTTPSATQPITLTNNGNMALSITGITITGTNLGDFGQTNTCGASLAATLSCTITVTFTPTAAGTRTAAVSIADNLAGSPQTVALTGTGVAPVAGLSGNSLTFTAQTLSTTSAAQTVTLTNTGTSALTITGITIVGTNLGEFAQTNTCGASLAISANCTISVTFTPTANGARTASVSIADSASGSPQTVSLTGTGGTPAASFNSTTLTFSNQVVSTPSTAQSVTLTNTGTVPLSITGIAVTGANSADFAQTNTCGASVAASANCTISVIFTPGALGARSATVNVTDNAAGSPQAITLNGTGVAAPPTASLSSTSLSFTDQFVGTSAAAQTVTLTNNSTSALTITSIAVTGASNADYAQTNTCGASLAGKANCTISATFTPTASGARPATITVTDNAPTGTQTVSLTGNGFTISLAAASGGSMSQTVKAGQTATYSLQLTTTGGSPTVAFSCSGAPSKATCNVPTVAVPVTAAAPVPVSITVSTTATAIFAPQSQPEMQPPAALRNLPLTLLAVLLCIAAMLAWMQSPAGRMRTVRVALTACLVLLPISAATLLTGCASSGGSSVTPPPVPGTPAGSYTITVTMTVSGKAQATPLTLIVQ